MPPRRFEASLPADEALVPAARMAVAAVVRLMGCGASMVAALRDASGELASTLVERAAPWARLDIELDHDEEDVYLRMQVDRTVSAEAPRMSRVTRLLLAGTIDSADVGEEGGRVYAVVQRAIDR